MSQTQPDGRVMRCYKGELTDEGVECQAFRSEEGGTLYPHWRSCRIQERR
jgi:hypothetical protein